MTDVLKRSRYALLSDRSFRAPDGARYRFGFASRTAKMFRLREVDAESFTAGRFDEIHPDLVRELTEIEALVSTGEDELGEVTRRRRESSTGARLRRLVFLPTSYCNMGCAYCGQEHTKTPVVQRRVQQKIDRAKAALADPDTTALHVAWFGGEPLLGLRVMREISAVVVPEAQRLGKPYSADVVTNGSLLTHRVLRELYDECAIRWIEVTIDGPREVHDQRRAMRNGSATFDRIVDLIAEVVAAGSHPELTFGIRTNVDNQNEDRIAELIVELARRGLASPRVILKPAPVHSWGNDVADRELKRWEYAKRELEWAALAQGLGMTFPATLPLRPRAATCIATSRSSEVVDSAGRVYTCTEHPLVPVDSVRGQVSSLDVLPADQHRPEGLFDSWYDEVEAGQWPCATCPFMPVCGGGCPKLWKEGELPCPSYKFTWRERLDNAAIARGLVADG
ncbi:radical SAM protein [Phytohabitans kaempferiae]|uniref:Radical SAM protein n=1 Tax=Phytohabitans kaempferiae TaxID=1620943 RepID=A0ABV6M5I1_9ACTN